MSRYLKIDTEYRNCVWQSYKNKHTVLWYWPGYINDDDDEYSTYESGLRNYVWKNNYHYSGLLIYLFDGIEGHLQLGQSLNQHSH